VRFRSWEVLRPQPSPRLKSLFQGTVRMTIATNSPEDEDAPFPVVTIPPEDRTPEAVVRRLLAHASQWRGEAAERAVREYLHRESLGSTNVGRGVAVPQIIGPFVDQTTIIAGRLTSPIDWPDGEPVRHVFLVLAPNSGATLQWMEEIARHMSSINA
jgi:mannitol/fructose-specific phosphotransferase system IIA component